MAFLEGVILNVMFVVVCMYLDKYVLDDYCKEHPQLDSFFRVWLVVTFLSVLVVLFEIIW